MSGAAKRIAVTAVDWAALGAKIPESQKGAFAALKMKADGHMRAVNALPAAAPSIDFAAYASKITVAGMVENFEKQYTALAIPYPGDQGKLAEIDAQAKEQEVAQAGFCAESKGRIAGFAAELAKWEATMPVEEMNKEELLDAGLTDFVIDPNVPSFFPHDETWESYVERLKAAEPEAH